MVKLNDDFFQRDVLVVAPELPGKFLAIIRNDAPEYFMITEVEAYKGTEDKACHASKGRTKRTEIMFHTGGYIYVYFVYGMYWMLNIVTGPENDPQAVLIRKLEGLNGPGILTRSLNIDKSYYGENICSSSRIWTEDKGVIPHLFYNRRIGIGYAGEPWVSNLWRFSTKM
jgi:DNA-3-methyladenine glycosylase